MSKGIDEHKFNEWLDAEPSRREAYRREIDAANGDAKDHVKRKWRKAAGARAGGWRTLFGHLTGQSAEHIGNGDGAALMLHWEAMLLAYAQASLRHHRSRNRCRPPMVTGWGTAS